MVPTSESTAMALQPRGGLARTVGLIGTVCALCGVALWAVGQSSAASAVPQVQLYVPGQLRGPETREKHDPEGVSSRADVPPPRVGTPNMMSDATKGPMTAVEQLALNDDLNSVVSSGDMCTRRHAMARAAGLAAGLAVSVVNKPAFAAETKMVKMGSDSGQLVFVPDEIKICKGDTVTWTNNKGGPHNVVFDEEAIPSGVNAESISMDDQLGDEGATYSKKFDVAGSYSYYCEPHRGAGMQATLIVG